MREPFTRQLTLTRKLALLAIDPESGRLRGPIGYGLGAATLLDLADLGRLSLFGPIRVVDERPTGDRVLDEALRRIVDEPRQRPAADWVRNLGRGRDLRERLITELEQDSLIQGLDRHLLAFVPAQRYCVTRPRLRAQLVAEVRAALLGPRENASVRERQLAALVWSVGLLDRFVARDEWHLAATRAAVVGRSDSGPGAVIEAVTRLRVLATASPVGAVSGSAGSSP